MFVDFVKIHVKGGDGGNGCISFRREKFVPRGGPNGGDGGNGGSVYLETDSQIATLLDLRYRPLHRAGRGQHGKGKNMHGRNGKDIIIKVPLGTVVTEGDIQVADLTKPGQRYCAAKGGKGGFGNQHFTTSVRQAPRYAEKGKLGEERSLILELKIIADVGIIGLPNAGKSTLLAHITHATPKIAAYPFTTIHPNLGIYEKNISGEHIVMADIPGLIEGASRGAGLGDRFLRHIERTRILVHLIAFDESTMDFSALYEKYEMVLHELSVYSDRLLQKPQILILNKIDLVSPKKVNDVVKAFRTRGMEILPVSAKEKKGLDVLLPRIEEILEHIQTLNESDQENE